MSLRTLIRLAALALGLLLSTPLLWPLAGPIPAVVASGLVLLTLGYLLLAAGSGHTSRWQVRYQMEARQANERLDATLTFLASRAGHVVLEANSQGLFLEAPATFDRYIQVQLERALPQARLSRVSSTAKDAALCSNNNKPQRGSSFYLCLDPLAGDPLRWATEEQGRQVRLHIRRGPYATFAARAADGVEPPGRWTRFSVPRLVADRLWCRLPVWDELSTGLRPSFLLPHTGDDAVYSSRSRLLRLAPPDGFQANGERPLGHATDGRPLSLECTIPLFTAGAPSSFLVQQAVEDLGRDRVVVVVSPQRRLLNLVQRQAQAMAYWLDQENARLSAHLAATGAGEWDGLEVETVIELAQGFLTSLGLELHLPAVRTLVSHLVRILAGSAKATGHDFAFTDLYAISQSTQTLRAFLADLRGLERDLDPDTRASIGYLAEQLEGNMGYVQVVTVLSTVRAVLRPIRTGSLHVLCQPPFLDVNRALGKPCLVLVPLTNADFPEYDRFLAAMLDLTLKRVLATGREDFRLALHLHDPHLCRDDGGQRWIEAARQDPRLSLLLNVEDPDVYEQTRQADGERGELIFHCSEMLASSLIEDWDLTYSIAELTELPEDTALARLPGLPAPVTLKAGGE